jgi:hypothetical protein
MSSVAARYAQRNNNVTQVVPSYVGVLDNPGSITDISGCQIYNLEFPNVQYTGGIYVVDLSGNDSSGNPIDFSGLFFPITSTDPSGYPISTVAFTVTVPHNPAHYPGLEFTVFFKNIPFDRFSGPPLLTIGILTTIVDAPPFPYLFSPPIPSVFPGVNQSITLKSDGNRFNIVSSGPAGWMGTLNLAAILTFYNTTPP